MSRIIVDAIRNSSASSDGITLSSDGKVTFPNTSTGKILQVVSTTKTDVFSEDVASSSFSGDAMSVSITPSNASNKIMLFASCSLGIETTNDGGFAFFKAGSLLTGAVADADGSRARLSSVRVSSSTGQWQTINGQHLDTAGGTSAITYSVRLHHGANALRYVYLNRSHTDANQGYDFRAVSSLTAMEVAA